MTALLGLYTFEVRGEPKPQGSKRAMPIYRTVDGQKEWTGKTAVVEQAGVPLKTWRGDIIDAAKDVVGDNPPYQGPVGINLWFSLKRPGNLPKTKQSWPVKRPDIDKLTRSVLDALTSAGVYKDDSQVVILSVQKLYVGDAGSMPTQGVYIEVQKVVPDSNWQPLAVAG